MHAQIDAVQTANDRRDTVEPRRAVTGCWVRPSPIDGPRSLGQALREKRKIKVKS